MKRLRLRMGLRWQLVLLFLLVSLIPLLIVALLAHWAGKRALTDIVRKDLISEAHERLAYANYIIRDVIYERRPTQLRSIRRKVESTNDDNRLTNLKRAHEDLLNSVVHLERRVGANSQIIITNRHQQVIFATDDQLLFQKIDEPWWDKVYNNGIGYRLVGNVEYDFKTQQYSLPVTMPIMGPPPESKVVGVLRFVALLPTFSEVVSPQKEGEEICLFDQYGRIICAPPDSGHQFLDTIEMTNAAGDAINARDEYHGSDMEGETDARGEKRIYGWARTMDWNNQEEREEQNPTDRRRLNFQFKDQNFANWRVLASLPTSVAFSEVTKFTKIILWFTLISCLVVIAIALVVSQSIVRPIRQVTGAGACDWSRRVQSGNSGHR